MKSEQLQQQFNDLLSRNPHFDAVLGTESTENETIKKQWLARLIGLLRGIAGYFHTHPDQNVFFVCADDLPYYTKVSAEGHAKKLENKEITEIRREDMQLIADVINPSIDGGSSVKSYDKMNRVELQAELVKRGIKFDTKKDRNSKLITLLTQDDIEKATAQVGGENTNTGGGEDTNTGGGEDTNTGGGEDTNIGGGE